MRIDERATELVDTLRRLGDEYGSRGVLDTARQLWPTACDVDVEMEQLRELAYSAWGVIANAHQGDWSAAANEWSLAAVRWRERFHALCGGPDHDEVKPTTDGRRAWIPGIGGPQSVAATDDVVDKLDVIRLIHSRRNRTVDGASLAWCVECQQDWPCKTIEVLQA